MSIRNYNDYDYNYRETLMNRIKVNKRANENNKSIKYYNCNNFNRNLNTKDNLYYSIEKRPKNQRNKIPASFKQNSLKKITKEQVNTISKYSNRNTYKKTINTYSGNRIKDSNIFEELQNNKYLRPMLGNSNIDTKLLKCKIEEPIKNIGTLSLKNYFANNIEFPFQKFQSPQKHNYNVNDLSVEEKINLYKLNNKTAMERFNINISNGFSPSKEIIFVGDNNSNSFAYSGDSYVLNNYLLKYSTNNIKKFSAINQVGRVKKEKYFYSEERKENDDSTSIQNQRSKKLYYKNMKGDSISWKQGTSSLKSFKSIENCTNTDGIKRKMNLRKKNEDNNDLLLVYKSKLVEEFIIVLNKFFNKNLNKNRRFFFKNLKSYKLNHSNNQNKIYFKKKNHRFNKKKLIDKTAYIDKDKDKDKEKIKGKVTTDTSTNFNMNNKSFSNEIKNSSLSNNFILNNIKINNQSSSFLFSEKRNKNYSQSPEDSLNNKYEKCPKTQIRTKTIIYKKQLSGSPNKIIKSTSPNDRKGSIGKSGGEAGKETFVYKKKNLNNENMSINKNNNFYSQNKKYKKIVNNNNKGKIIDIDINLGKPVNFINDHSPLDDLLLENNSQMFQMNTISSKIMKKNKKKNKTRSGSKNKLKPPIRLKKYAEEEDEDELLGSYYIDSNRAHSSIKKFRENKYLYNNFEEIINKINRESINRSIDNPETITEGDGLCIRNNYYSFYDNKKKNRTQDDNFSLLTSDKRISMSLLSDLPRKNKFEKNTKNKVSKLYINCINFLVKLLNRIIKKKIYTKIIQRNK